MAKKASAPKLASKPAAATTIFQLKITLLDTKPPIWRRVLVPAETRLSGLHDVIQLAMGWENSHLHAFEADGRRYEPRPPRGIPIEFDTDAIDERTVSLETVLRRPKASLIYEYDFGDGWMHEVRLEAHLPREPGLRYPQCTDGARLCPPEDCGGVWGYYNLLEAQSDPKHQDHEDLMEWLGGMPLDPEAFELKEINKRLAALWKESKRQRTWLPK